MKRLLIALLVTLVVLGCQQQENPMNNTTEPPVTPEPNVTVDNTTETPDRQELSIELTEEGILPSTISATPGETNITVRNTGQLYNELRIVGGNLNITVENGLFPDEEKILTVELQAGTYEVFSPIPGKRDEGYEAELQVE